MESKAIEQLSVAMSIIESRAGYPPYITIRCFEIVADFIGAVKRDTNSEQRF